MWENPDFENQYGNMAFFFVFLACGTVLNENVDLQYFAFIFYLLACIILTYVVKITYTRMKYRVKNNAILVREGIRGLVISFILSYVCYKAIVFIGKTGYWFWRGDPFPLIPFIQDRSFLL